MMVFDGWKTNFGLVVFFMKKLPKVRVGLFFFSCLRPGRGGFRKIPEKSRLAPRNEKKNSPQCFRIAMKNKHNHANFVSQLSKTMAQVTKTKRVRLSLELLFILISIRKDCSSLDWVNFSETSAGCSSFLALSHRMSVKTTFDLWYLSWWSDYSVATHDSLRILAGRKQMVSGAPALHPHTTTTWYMMFMHSNHY